MLLDGFDYRLPQELIAQTPPGERGASRQLHLDGRTGQRVDRQFHDFARLAAPA